jgi:hypothetical protein
MGQELGKNSSMPAEDKYRLPNILDFSVTYGLLEAVNTSGLCTEN